MFGTKSDTPRDKSDTLLTDALGNERKQAESKYLGNLGVLVAGGGVVRWSGMWSPDGPITLTGADLGSHKLMDHRIYLVALPKALLSVAWRINHEAIGPVTFLKSLSS